MLREELQVKLGLKDRKSFRELYLKPALEAGFIEVTIPDKPTSRLRRYRKVRGRFLTHLIFIEQKTKSPNNIHCLGFKFKRLTTFN
jgi:hypothetical protein